MKFLGIATGTILSAAVYGQMLPGSSDELLPKTREDVVRGPVLLDEPQCRALGHAFWVRFPETEEGSPGPRRAFSGCIRYFPSSGVSLGKPLLVFLHGDRVEKDGVPGSSRSAQFALAQRIETLSGMPSIVLARPGVYGSTGLNHQYERRSHTEVCVVSAALDLIKKRWGVERLSLAGQSGGAHLAIAMVLIGRNDLDVVSASGAPLAVQLRARMLTRRADRDISTGQAWDQVFDPIDHLASALPDSSRKLFLIADPRDQRIPFPSVLEFVRAAKKVGLPLVVLNPSRGGGVEHHNHFHIGLRVIAWYRFGLGDHEIVRRVSALKEGEPS